MKEKKISIQRVTAIAMLAALSYVVFTFLQIKISLPGGDATSIHLGNAVCVLGALLMGGFAGGLGGAIGMLLGVPVFSVLYTLINEATDRRVPESGIEEGDMGKDMGKDMENGNSDEKTESLVPEAVGGGSGADGKNG